MRRILLDEGDATAFPNDWKRIPDRDLLERMTAVGYDLLLTSDKNMAFQQTLADRPVSILIMDQVDRRRVRPQASAIADGIGLIEAGNSWRLLPEGRVLRFPTIPGM